MEAQLVGSVALGDAEQVFRVAMTHLRGHLRRIPDGERGRRDRWFGFQYHVLCAADGIEPGPAVERSPGWTNPQIALTRPVAALELPALGYAEDAAASYAVFVRLREEGVIPATTRFQVCMPTPVAVIGAFVSDADQAAFEPVYEAAMLREVAAIAAAIPHRDLAFQWDVAVETAILEGVAPHWLGADDLLAAIAGRLARLGAAVPDGVELGYHLCYGYRGRRHFKQPDDLALLVRMANAIDAELSRSIDWLHMPVPADRDDVRYFAPLRDLRVPSAQLYLGLVHDADGVEGARRRAAAAQAALGGRRGFGVATECGMGQVPAGRDAEAWVAETLAIHAALG